MKTESILPHDHPSLRRDPRLYFSITNHCNRACPWCCVYSSPQKSSYLSIENMVSSFPASGSFEVQLEGGEPTTHPDFWKFIETVRSNGRVSLVVLCTNGVLIPRERSKLSKFLDRLGSPLMIKLSINHHLLATDPGLFELAVLMQEEMANQPGRTLVLNLRRRKGIDNDDQFLVDELGRRDLLHLTNDFFLQRYGYASDRDEWDRPFTVKNDFQMINPDGKMFEGDLIARSEAMGQLP